MARRNPAASVIVIDDDVEVTAANPLPVTFTLPTGDNTIGRVKLTDGTDVALIGADGAVWIGHGKTLKVVTGTISTDTDIVAAVAAKRIKVYSLSLMMIGATAVTVTMQSNASTAIATYILQAPASVTAGIAENGRVPDFLFATVAGEKLTLDVSAAVNVTYNMRYWDDDAT